MAKLTLTDIGNLASAPNTAESVINANWAAIEAALENTLSRDGTSPNPLSADLDMDGNTILNLPAATADTHPIRKAEFDEAIAGLTAPAADATVIASIYTTVGPAGSDADYEVDGTADEVEINQAISDRASAGGGVVQLLPNSSAYNIASAIRVKSNIILQGQGGGTLIRLADNANDRCITNHDHTDGNSNFTVRNLTVNGNGDNQTFSTVDALYFLRCQNYVIDQNYVYDANRHSCFSSVDCQRGRIVRNRFDNPRGLSNIAAFEAFDMVFSQNITSGATETGIKLDDSHTCVISNNVFTNNDTQQIYVTGGSNITITGNAVRGGQHGVRITSADYITVSGNVMRDHSRSGVHLLQNCNFIIITGNMIRNVGTESNTYSGVYAEDVGTGCTDVIVTGNIMVDTGGTMKYGLHTTGNSNRFTYGANIISGALTANYSLVGANNVTTF